jgi:hypothetical protein
MPKSIDIRTVNDKEGTPVLEVIKERNSLLICETNNMHRNVKLTLSEIPTLIDTLETLLSGPSTYAPSFQELCGNGISSRSVMLAQERVDG